MEKKKCRRVKPQRIATAFVALIVLVYWQVNIANNLNL